jgi:N6-adenosine-specific RNA methylase IME4
MRMHDPSGNRRSGPERRSLPVWDEFAGPADPIDQHKDPLAVEFGRRGGLKGGRARAEKLSASERTGIARRAAEARWAPRTAAAVAVSPSVDHPTDEAAALLAASTSLRQAFAGQRFGTLLADPPWRFANRTGKVAPEHRRLSRYATMSWREIAALPVRDVAADKAHCYLWTPNALVMEALQVLEEWGFTYKTMLVWHKVRKDGGSDGRGVGFYFRNVTETVLFGVRGSLRTFQPGRRQVNLLATRKREHSRKPDELYSIVEQCSPGPFLELFARYPQPGWSAWGDEADPEVEPRGKRHKGYGA